jgi:hypothetical protein
MVGWFGLVWFGRIWEMEATIKNTVLKCGENPGIQEGYVVLEKATPLFTGAPAEDFDFVVFMARRWKGRERAER